MAGDAATVLSVENLDVRYASGGREVIAVADATFALKRGQCFGLVGESGCGKSTIAMAIMRYLGPQGRVASGRILFGGSDMSALSASELRAVRGGRIAMIYQDASTALNPTMTLGAQLAEVLRTHSDLSRWEVRDRVVDMLASVGIPDPLGALQRFPHQVSGGQQQRIVIAMAFLAEPELLILDEPTTALDMTVEAEIVKLLRDMRAARGATMLFISHNLQLVREICGEVGVMYAGQIVETGAANDVLRRPRHPYTRALAACAPRLDAGRSEYRLTSIPGYVPRLRERPDRCTFRNRCADARAGICDLPVAMEDLGGGAGVRCHRWREAADAPADEQAVARLDAAAPRREVLRLDRVSKSYDVRGLFSAMRRDATVQANDAISFALAAGETLGVVGESGCGKSTVARIIMGLSPSSSGRVILLGDDVTLRMIDRRSAEQIRNVQMVFQNPDSTLNPSHSVGFILDRAVRRLGMARCRAKRMAEVERLLDLVRLSREVMSMPASQLSGGQKQRVAIARAFAGRPTLVVADEPTSALDASVKTAILELLIAAQKQTGTALIFISHDLAVVRYIADHVAVMYRGQIVEIGRVADVFAPPYHPYTEALLSAAPGLGNAAARRGLHADETETGAGRTGCVFTLGCAGMMAGLCDRIAPPFVENATGHLIRCHRSRDELLAAPSPFRHGVPAADDASRNV